MIQTCAVACYSISISGGYGAYLLALNKKTYELAGVNTPANHPGSYMELKLGWVIGYNLIVCFVGLFVLIPLRKILIVDYKLPFPSGLATAVLINGFHSKGDKLSRKQVRGFMKYFSFSFLWGFFQWFFTGKAGDCGFSQFPTFGLQAWKQSFYFDFSLTYIGTGMICSHLVNLSLLLGAVISWGIMWPLINKLEGNWFPADLPGYSMQGLSGYKVFISIALIFGDGLYIFLKVIYIIIKNIHDRTKNQTPNTDDNNQNTNPDLHKQNELFVRERIPMWISGAGYIPLSIVSTIVIPFMFPQIKWYYVIVAYILSPIISFANAYGAGLTDQNMAYNYGKVAIFILAALAGKDNGLVAGLVGCGVIKSVAFVSCTLMQDFKTGHMTLSSPRSMLISQAVGTAIGCIAASLSFFLFYQAFDVGNPTGEYKAPYALIYRNMAILGVQGFSALPQHCLQLCYGFFAIAVGLNLLRDLLPSRIGKLMPLPMVMAVPFLVGGYFAIDMCVGSLIVFTWQKLNPKKANFMIPVVASGFISGEGIWSLPAALLALAKVKAPICMKFLASSAS
ncbi:metal-nicotianamine transporter YSL1-like isoform X2 [Chenopodium quinoa]|nr:metal-nicotianamine transporter YSL1-like isoform X2 [Chenopodium quinoa]